MTGRSNPHSKTLQDRKKVAVEFLQLVVAGRVDEAFRKHVDMKGKHHNQLFPASFSSLRRAMVENHARLPKKQLTISNVLEGGDLVAVHSRIFLRPGEPGIMAVHLFRFNGDKIVEMWDGGKFVPVDSANENE